MPANAIAHEMLDMLKTWQMLDSRGVVAKARSVVMTEGGCGRCGRGAPRQLARGAVWQGTLRSRPRRSGAGC